MQRSDRILGSLLLLGAAVTIAYWVNYVVATVTMCWRRALAGADAQRS